MEIVELEEGECDAEGGGRGESERSLSEIRRGESGFYIVKIAAVWVGAWMLFYPTVAYNVVRYKLQPNFHWWDKITEFLLLGAVPFPSDVLRLKKLGVFGVVTLNEPYETLVPTSLYHAHGINHLHIPTRDYLFAPSFEDICLAVDFIHRNSICGKMTYVHCKAGRGRSTTVVLCYLVQHKQMTPIEAHDYVKSSRPRIRLASSQWKAVQDFYDRRVQIIEQTSHSDKFIIVPSPTVFSTRNFVASDENSFEAVSQSNLDGFDSSIETSTRNFVASDENSFEVVSQSDLHGYDSSIEASILPNGTWGDRSLAYNMQIACQASWVNQSFPHKLQIARQAALVRLSYFWNR